MFTLQGCCFMFEIRRHPVCSFTSSLHIGLTSLGFLVVFMGNAQGLSQTHRWVPALALQLGHPGTLSGASLKLSFLGCRAGLRFADAPRAAGAWERRAAMTRVAQPSAGRPTAFTAARFQVARKTIHPSTVLRKVFSLRMKLFNHRIVLHTNSL